MENSPSAIMSCVLCGGLSALLSISWTKLETVFVAIWTHLKSSAYGLVLSPVSVNYILEQGVGQLSTHVTKTLGNRITDGTVIATLRSFSQSSRTNVKYSREEISCVFSTYLVAHFLCFMTNQPPFLLSGDCFQVDICLVDHRS